VPRVGVLGCLAIGEIKVGIWGAMGQLESRNLGLSKAKKEKKMT
jgi:hypothetical protein